MKKFKIILIAILAVTLSSAVISCKKKSAEPETSQSQTSPLQTAQSVVGTWEWTNLKDSSSGNVAQNYTIAATDYTVPGTSNVITFNSSGAYTSGCNFSQIGTPNNRIADYGTYTNADSLILTSTLPLSSLTPPYRPNTTVRAKILSATSTNLIFIFKTGTNFHTCYYTKQ